MSQHVSLHRKWSSSVDVSKTRYVFHFAMDYWDKGWTTIPLHGKKPALQCWKEYQSRKPTDDEVRRWFAASNTDLNIGIVMGAVSGLVVADCDNQADANWWLTTYPPSPLMVETGRGLHIYYRMPQSGLGNRAKLFGRAIDLKAEGSYVVAPPSRHLETGKLYTWTNCGDNYSLESVPMFDPTWLGAGTSVGEKLWPNDNDFGYMSTSRSHRTRQRIKGLLRYLDEHEHEPDRSTRDFGCVMALLRLGCSPSEVDALVRGHSKFRGNERYLKLTIANAVKQLGR